MSADRLNVLVVGATGSIGRLVVAEALRQGHAVRALVRNVARADGLPQEAQRVLGDLTRADSLAAAVDGINAVVFTHGSNGGRRRPSRWTMVACATCCGHCKAAAHASR